MTEFLGEALFLVVFLQMCWFWLGWRELRDKLRGAAEVRNFLEAQNEDLTEQVGHLSDLLTIAALDNEKLCKAEEGLEGTVAHLQNRIRESDETHRSLVMQLEKECGIVVKRRWDAPMFRFENAAAPEPLAFEVTD